MHVSSESHASYSPPSRLGSAFGGNFKGSEHKFSQRLPETSSQRVAIFKPSRWCFFYIASLFEEFFWLFLCCLLKMKKKHSKKISKNDSEGIRQPSAWWQQLELRAFSRIPSENSIKCSSMSLDTLECLRSKVINLQVTFLYFPLIRRMK